MADYFQDARQADTTAASTEPNDMTTMAATSEATLTEGPTLMAYPPGVSLATITIGAGRTMFGAPPKLISATITPIFSGTPHVVHAESGWAFYPTPQTFRVEHGEELTIEVPHVNAEGWRDTAGNEFPALLESGERDKGWAYHIKFTVVGGSGQDAIPHRYEKIVQPLVGQTQPIDIDLVPDGQIGQPLSAPIASVLSIAGLTGNVTEEDLEALGLGGATDGELAALTQDPDSEFGTVFGEKLGVTEVANSAFLVKGLKVAIGSDSIGDGAGSTNTAVFSFWSRLQKIVGSARATIVEHGVPGESAAGLLARMPAILAENPAAFVLSIGMNPSASLAAYKSEITQILDMTRDARVPTLIALVTPRREDPAHRERIDTYNLWLRHIAAVRGLPIVDTFTPLVDPATGYLRPEYAQDAAHPNNAGHLEIAKAIGPALKGILPAALPLATSVGTGLVANPLGYNGTWNAFANPTAPATAAAEIVDPVPGDGLTAGKWLKMSVDATAATATANYLRIQDLTTVPAVGDLLLVTAQVKTSDERPGVASVQLMDGSTTVVSTIGDEFGVTNPGIMRKIVTAPTFANPARIRVSVSALAGGKATAYFGAVQVYNLTAMGLTELA